MPGKAMLLAPLPMLTVTVRSQGGDPEVRLRADGPGCRQARVMAALDAPPVLCGCFGGEAGPVLRQLLAGEGIGCGVAQRSGRNGTRVRDRRDGRAYTVAEFPGDPLTPQEADRLHEVALAEGARAAVCVLSPPPSRVAVPADLYHRLARDLRARGGRVVADLTGEALTAALAGGVDVLRIDRRELAGGVLRDEVGDLVAAMRRLRSRGADTIVVCRADRPALAMIGDEVIAVPLPGPRPAVPAVPPGSGATGADDSGASGECVTAAIAAGLATGLQIEDAVRLGVAAGALQRARPVPGGFDPGAVRRLAERVEVHEPALGEPAGGAGAFW